jgi:hypothetical protein
VASRKTADRDNIFGDEPAEGNFASDRYLPVAIHDFDLAPAMEGSNGRYVGSVELVVLGCNAASRHLMTHEPEQHWRLMKAFASATKSKLTKQL